MGREGTILKLNPYDLHGVRYYQMFIEFDDAPGKFQEVRLPNDVVYTEPAAGDRVAVDQLLSMVTGVRKLEARSS